MSACLVFALSLWRETKNMIHVKSILGLVAAGVILDIVKSLAFSTRTISIDVTTTFQLAGPNQLIAVWPNVVDAMLYTHDGLLGSWIILGLGFFGGLALRFKELFDRLLILWVGVASLPFLLLDSYHKARIVYDLPIPMLASTGAVLVASLIGGRNLRWPGLWVVIMLVLLAAYAVQGLLLL